MINILFGCLPSTMQQYQGLKFNHFKMCPCATCFGLHQCFMKTSIAVAWKPQQVPKFQRTDDGQVGRNMQCKDEF
jgi:hypothetical protein